MSAREVAKATFDEQLFGSCNIVLFEDDKTETELFPLSVLRPSWEIFVGMGNARQWLSELGIPGSNPILRPRALLHEMAIQIAGSGKENFDEESETIFVNGRVFACYRNVGAGAELPYSVSDSNGRLLLLKTDGKTAAKLMSLSGTELVQKLVELSKGSSSVPTGWTISSARYIWDFMAQNSDLLIRQLSVGHASGGIVLNAHCLKQLPPGVYIYEPQKGHPVYSGVNVKIMPGAVFGNHHGPIWLGDNSEIEPHTYLEGPLYIGPNCRVKAGTRLYHGVSMGPHCRVGGEISQSILQGFINKQHDGFLGNSHLGQWINLGADTTNSNLRNDYGNVKVKVGDRVQPTGLQFVGLLAGDHTKSGINTMFNTGTVAGVACNIYGSGYPYRYIPSFAWGGAEGFKLGSIEQTITSARMVMSRRQQTLTQAEESLLRRHYAEAAEKENLN